MLADVETGRELESRSFRTARHLQSLYVVGAGLGVAVALGNMLTGSGEDPAVDWSSVPVVIAFVATLVPFFHGAMMYMDAAFSGPPAYVLVDFIALFSQTLLFFVMAGFIREPTSFVWSLTALLIVDIAWIVWLRRKGIKDYTPWAVINTVCVAVLVLLIALHHWPQGPNLMLAGAIAVIALARSAADYVLGRNVYFD